MALVTTKVNGLWVAKQTAKGVLPATAIKRARIVTGNVRSNRADGREKFGTDDRWGDAQHFVDSLTGSGDPGIQAQPGLIAYLLYLFAGQESVTGAADPYTHTIEPSATSGFWSRWWKKVGVTPDLIREAYNDCKIGAITIEGSTGQKVVRVTPTLLSLDPGEVFAADPVKAFDDEDAFIYTEGESAFEVDGATIRAQSQFNITLNENLEPVMTDSPVPIDLAPGDPEATIALTLALNTEGLAIYNKQMYDDPAPAAGTKPLKTIPAVGSYGFTLTKSASRTFGFSMSGVKWQPDAAIAPNPTGGLTEVSLAGEVRRVSGQPAWSAEILNGDAAYA
jgi:hypothetical protein